jgi:hypothetical protein
LIEETENHRIHTVLGTGDFGAIGVAYSWIANDKYKNSGTHVRAPFALLIAYTDDQIWAIRRPMGYQGYSLVPWDRKAHPLASKTDFSEGKKGEKPLPLGWTQGTKLDMRVRSLVLTNDAIVMGGGPLSDWETDPFAVRQGQRKGTLKIVATQDGSDILSKELPASVIWNGLAVTDQTIYVATADGTVLCLGGES